MYINILYVIVNYSKKAHLVCASIIQQVLCKASLFSASSLKFPVSCANVMFSKAIKSMLMHPEDKVDPSLKKEIVYQWSCTKPNCKSSYIGETSRSLCEWVKEYSKEWSNSAIYQHCSTKDHPPPNIDQFKVIDQEKSQMAREAKEAIHIRTLDPELNRNVGKMVIPHVFDSLLGIKPKNPHVASLLYQEVGSQDIGINLTQFHSCVDKRVNHCSNRAQRARNFISN